MVDTRLAEHLIESLPSGLADLFNPWRDACSHDAPGNGPEAKLLRLASHLDCDARLILLGEAAGYQGCRYTGIGFCSERLVMEGAIPRVTASSRLSTRALPFSEPSATIVWKNLYKLGLEKTTICWNALHLHPFRPADGVWTNRTPTERELDLGIASVKRLREHFPKAVIVGVGQKAVQTLAKAGIASAGGVRHPAYGGATEFESGLKLIMAGKI